MIFRMNKRIVIVSLSCVIAFQCMGNALKATSDVLWIGKEHLLVQDSKKPKVLQILNRFLKVESSIALKDKKKLVGFHISPDSKWLAIAEATDDGKFKVSVSLPSKGQTLFEVPERQHLRSLFWIDECRLGILTHAANSADPLSHDFSVFEVPQKVRSAHNVVCAALAKSPDNQYPLAFFIDQEKVWGISRQSEKIDLTWIGQKNITHLTPGKDQFFYFLQNEILFRARHDTQKVQPISKEVKNFALHKNGKDIVVLKNSGKLELLSAKKNVDLEYNAKDLRETGIIDLWKAPNADWMILKTSDDRWELEALL